MDGSSSRRCYHRSSNLIIFHNLTEKFDRFSRYNSPLHITIFCFLEYFSKYYDINNHHSNFYQKE